MGSLRGKRKGRIPVSYEHEGVRDHACTPSYNALHEIEHASRISPSEDDDEPSDEHHDQQRDPQEEQDDVVGNRQEPLHEGQPSVQTAPTIRVGIVEMYILLLIGG